MKKRAMIIGLEDKANKIKKFILQNKLDIKIVDFWNYVPRDNNDKEKQQELIYVLPKELNDKKIDIVIFALEETVSDFFGENIVPPNIEKFEMRDFFKQFDKKYKKKILYILTKSDLGGVSNYLLEIVNMLPKEITPYFIMSSKGYFSEKLEKLNLKDNIFFVPMTNSVFNIPLHIKSNLQALKIIREIKPDLIHCNSTTGGIIGRVCGALSNIPVIFTAHGWAFTDGISKGKQIFYKVLEMFLAVFTKKIICVSEFDRQIALKVMPFFKNKLITIHNGISDISANYQKTEFSKDKIRIVMVSRFCLQKDPYTLIKAVNELCNEGLNLELDLYGYGEELEQVVSFIDNCQNTNIKYCGEISDVTPILKNYDVYSLISNWEGLPIGIIEGMRSGLPVIACNVGGNSEAVFNTKNGFIIERKDKNTLKECLKSLYENKLLLYNFGTKSRELYKQNFLSENMLKETLEVYEKAVVK